jgi:DNA-directed RNA polymerase subunit RPC12/RpoP
MSSDIRGKGTTLETIACPGCGKTIGVPHDQLEKVAGCPHCKTRFLASKPDDGPAAARLVKRNPFAGSRAILPGWVMFFFGLLAFGVNITLALNAFTDHEKFVESLTKSFQDAAEAAKDPSIMDRLEITITWYPWIRLFSSMLGLMGLVGGIGMIRTRWHTLAMFGCFATMLNVIGCCCINLPIGGWALFVLMNPEVKTLFDQKMRKT